MYFLVFFLFLSLRNSNTMSVTKIATHLSEISFPANGIAVIELPDKKICVARYKEELFAFAYKCPHAGGILAEGHMDALGCVVCPLHQYRFDIRNGRNVSGEGFFLKRWPVRVEDDGIYVEFHEVF